MYEDDHEKAYITQGEMRTIDNTLDLIKNNQNFMSFILNEYHQESQDRLKSAGMITNVEADAPEFIDLVNELEK